MGSLEYLMENDEESIRLDLKTDPAAVEQQALWAEIKAGMRVADLGCGCGKTTSILHGLVQPGGEAVGVDMSEERLRYGREKYGRKGIEFVQKDLEGDLGDLGAFDFVWIRFILEYFRSNALDIVRNVSRIVRPGGTLCLVDLDHNCLNHFGLSGRLERTITRCMRVLEEKFNFDPYAGRKLYSFLYDLDFENISVTVGAHHVIYGQLGSVDFFNWSRKIKMVTERASFVFNEYQDGAKGFTEEFNRFFSDPRRFTYTPLICAKGMKPGRG